MGNSIDLLMFFNNTFTPAIGILRHGIFQALGLRACTVLLLSFIFFNSSAQVDRDKLAYEFGDQISMLMDSVDHYLALQDSSNIALVAGVLTTRMHNIRMQNRAAYYIDLALTYTNKEQRPIEYARICNRMGMYLASIMRDGNMNVGDTARYLQMADSARWWHRQAIVYSYNFNDQEAAGWGYRGLLQIDHHKLIDGMLTYDSAGYYYNNCMRIARGINNLDLVRHASNIYAQVLLQRNQIEEAAPIVQLLVDGFPYDNSQGNYSYYRIIHTYLAKKHNLDTLDKLMYEATREYQSLTANNHSNAISMADQQFEVSQTRKVLQGTIKDLNILSNNFYILVGISFSLSVAAGFIFLQFRKNRRLAIRNEGLLKEQNHRVKNNLQMIASMLSLQSKKINDEKAKIFLKNNETRVQSISLLNRLLYQQQDVTSVDLSIYLSTLCEELKYGVPQDIQFDITLPGKATIHVEKATSLGLIVNELVTNSCKHGGIKLSTIGICIDKQENGSWQLRYQDNGKGCDEGQWESSQSFGHQLIKIQLKQLHATYNIIKHDGFMFIATLPTNFI